MFNNAKKPVTPTTAMVATAGDQPKELADAIMVLLREQGFPVDKNRLQSSIDGIDPMAQPLDKLLTLLRILGIQDLPKIMPQPDGAFIPLLAYHSIYGWGRIVQRTAHKQWLFQQSQHSVRCQSEEFVFIAKIQLSTHHIEQRKITFAQLLKNNLNQHKGVILEAVIASLMINLLALASSLFSMQVYDRVIPTGSEYTLIILSTGVALVILFEMFMKFARSKIMDKMVVSLDQNLSRDIFERLLKVRVDQMPASVGSLAAQLRGYEQVRSFFTASTLFTLVDIPMSIVFIVIIGAIGSPWLSLVPIVAALLGISIGLSSGTKMDKAAAEGAAASYAKTGILVETVEGMETIKAGAGNWKFLSRWLNVMNVTVNNDLKVKHINDNLNYGVQMLQQISYVGIVIIGAYIVMKGELTTGGLIACTILGGRILAPIMTIPSLLMQYSHAKAAQANIENLFKLGQDNEGVNYPLSPSAIMGNYQCDNVIFKYAGNDRPALKIPQLSIRAGERIAILGAIGSGKSTLLKLLSGLYATSEGRVMLDGLDINQISRETMSEQIGYLQQDHRLFQGTLRENLLIGMPTPPDDVLQNALMRTGLIKLVSSHSSGIDLPISEGGRGLSGGQKQLVAFTRLVLTNPSVWLLDEPTASMDNMQEQQCLHVLAQELQKGGKTLIVSTHKMALLNLVDRIIIMADNQIVMDGPKQAVLAQLQKNENEARQKALAQQQAQQEAQRQLMAQQGQHPNEPPNPPNNPTTPPTDNHH